MALSTGIGKSKELDSFAAGTAAARQALEEIGGGEPDLAFCFASARFDHLPLIRGIRSVIHDAPILGCTTAGEITSLGPDTKSAVVLLLKFSDSSSCQASLGLGRNMSRNPRVAGQEVARDAVLANRHSGSRHAFLMFPDGLKGNGAEVIRGIQEVLGTSFPIVGGSAADDFMFENTFQYFDDKVFEDSVCGALFSGDMRIGIGARHGWYPLGKPRVVTEAAHNVIRKLDGKPAVRIYEDYFGRRVADMQHELMARMSVMYPLGMSIPEEEECIVRNALRVDNDGALICAGEVPEGSEIRVMMGSKETAMKAAKKAATLALEGLGDFTPELVFVFDSVSRERLFGRQASEEIDLVKNIFGNNVPIAGFYTYGEQAPLGATVNLGQTLFHNETIVIFAIGGK